MTEPPGRSQVARNLTSNPVLVGTAILAVAMLGIVLSYNANKGLPFVPTYQIAVDVPDAAELVEAGSEVRVGGARVGIVERIEAIKGSGGEKAFARLHLALQRTAGPIPADSRVKVRPRSILGAKYVELRLGRSQQRVLAGGRLPLGQADPLVELDEAFNTFDEETTRGIRGTITNLGDALAGRGSALNETIGEVDRLMPPLQRVLRGTVESRRELAGFIRGAHSAMRALAPVRGELGSLIDGAVVTLAALDDAGEALPRTIDELPPTEIAGTRALTKVTPVLADAAALARGLRDGARVLPQASTRLAAALEAGTPVLRRGVGLSTDLRATLGALDALSRDPASSGAVRKLTDLVRKLLPTLEFAAPAQLQCNVLPLYLRNLGSAVAMGDEAGGMINVLLVLQASQMLQVAEPAPDLHLNYYPNANTSECEAGNEPYAPGQLIGNPPGNQPNTTELTAPPPQSTEPPQRARDAAPVRPLRELVRALGRIVGGAR